ncbi:MAG: cytochrome c biogenesis protein CcsA [Planctomycetota bacterium]|jgi:ABC-type transport system involved in cytochrome c biogenesis permease subunit|nr:cytochrome c biogenesis protein CcsA [Planctomycetota bacterium]
MIADLTTSLLIGAAVAWTAGIASSLLATRAPRWHRLAQACAVTGLACLVAVIASMWVSMQRPPLRTLGETRLWYASLLVLIGLLLEWRLRTRSIRIPMLGFGLLFTAIALARPEEFEHTLMPALQSYWFVPHVVVYLTGYAALGLAAGTATWEYYLARREQRPVQIRVPRLLVRTGLAALTCGLTFGALWAKEAWGTWWNWDPKEIWAFLAWATYLVLTHHERRLGEQRFLLSTVLAFAVILGCWFLVNLLPVAETSVHQYAVSPT